MDGQARTRHTCGNKHVHIGGSRYAQTLASRRTTRHNVFSTHTYIVTGAGAPHILSDSCRHAIRYLRAHLQTLAGVLVSILEDRQVDTESRRDLIKSVEGQRANQWTLVYKHS